MDKQIHISLEDLLSDPDTKHCADNIIGILLEYKNQPNHNSEQPIGITKMNFKSEEFGLINFDLEVQLMEETEETTIARIGTRMLGINEEIYVEVSNEELRILYTSPLTPLNFKPLVQENGIYSKQLKDTERGT